MKKENPAEQLLEILEASKNYSSTDNCRKTWKRILDIPQADEALFMSRLGKVMQLPKKIIDEINKIEGTDSDIYQHWSTQINSGFTLQHLQGNWGTFTQHIDSHTIPYLKSTAQILNSHLKISALSDNQIDEIRQEVIGLIQKIRESNLDEAIKTYLLKILGELINSINEYKITGHDFIIQKIDTIVGHAVTDEEFRERMKNSDIGLWGTLAKISGIVTLATGVPQLAKDAIKLLTS